MTSSFESQIREAFAEEADLAPDAGPTISRALQTAGRSKNSFSLRGWAGVGLVAAAVVGVVAAGAIVRTLLDDGREHNEAPAVSKGVSQCNGVAIDLDGDVGIADASDCSFVPLTDTPGRETDPELSPVGDRLVFVRPAPSGGDATELVVIDLATREEDVVVTSAGAIVHPTWSADASALAFSASLDGDNVAIWAYDFGTGKTTKVSRAAAAAINPSWTSDPDVLVYRLTGDSPSSVVQNVRTDERQTLPYAIAALSPDGSQAIIVQDGSAPTDVTESASGTRLVLIDITGADVLAQSTEIPAPPFGSSVDVSWRTEGIVVSTGTTLIEFDNQLREIDRVALPGLGSVGLTAG